MTGSASLLPSSLTKENPSSLVLHYYFIFLFSLHHKAPQTTNSVRTTCCQVRALVCGFDLHYIISSSLIPQQQVHSWSTLLRSLSCGRSGVTGHSLWPIKSNETDCAIVCGCDWVCIKVWWNAWGTLKCNRTAPLCSADVHFGKLTKPGLLSPVAYKAACIPKKYSGGKDTTLCLHSQ